MRSAADFNRLYLERRDPWGTDRATRRDRGLAKVIPPYVEGKTVLELGCGEGHLTATIFSKASWITGVDISAVAILRASERRLPNATFVDQDFMGMSFEGRDVIAALECIYYLSLEEREAFFRKLAKEHRGTFIMSAPIIGGKYFTHEELLETFKRHGLGLINWRNVYAYRRPGVGGLAASVAARVPLVRDAVVALWPERFMCHRAYVVRCG